MLGYIESPYTVEKEADRVTKDGGCQRFEVRQSKSVSGYPMPQPYIAVDGRDAAGNLVLDILFRYDVRVVLDADWTRLIADESATARDLNYVEMICGHHVGYDEAEGRNTIGLHVQIKP
jgi:hypothetical protein